MARPRRIQGFNYEGPHRYLLTFCTSNRREVFRESRMAEGALLQFRRTARLEGFALLAYCVMPDHVHLLVEGRTASANLRRFAKRAKQSSGQTYAHRYSAPLWQEGFYERVLRGDTDLREVARYIIWNPVRAGLSPTPADYPFVGSPLLSAADLTRA